jgi:hypothetical protein
MEVELILHVYGHVCDSTDQSRRRTRS